jgi:hypothetical protein
VGESLPEGRPEDRVFFPFFHRNGSPFLAFPEKEVMGYSQSIDVGGFVGFKCGDVMAPAAGIVKDKGFARKKRHDGELYGGLLQDSRGVFSARGSGCPDFGAGGRMWYSL